MGQQASKKSNDIYFHKKIPPFFSTKKLKTVQKPEEPIKFQYKTPKKKAEKQKNKANNFDSFGFSTITNLKNVIDGVKSDCNGLKKCGAKNDNCEEYKLGTVPHSKNNEAVSKDNLEKQNRLAITRNEIRDVTNFKTEHPNGMKKSKKRTKDVKIKNVPIRTKSEPNLRSERGRDRAKRRLYDAGINNKPTQKFGYEIQDVDEFLAKATLHKPANIPVVLAFPSVLYQTRVGGYQAELSLPLGMVVNAIFKNQNWLYVQTPHAEEGYVSYSACLPLGIIPPADDDNLSPCWEKSTDIFPKPSGNMTDTEKLSYKSENEEDTYYCSRARYRTALSTCGEKSVDRLYLRAAAIAKGKGTRHTLLIINEDFKAMGKESLSVVKNEVVFLLNTSIKGWFYVKNKEGQEGFIPSVTAGHGFL